MSAVSTVKASAENPLNVRLSLSQSLTRKLGDDYSKTVAGVEMDLPTGMNVLEGLNKMRDTLELFFRQTEAQGQQLPRPNAEELDKLSWTAYKEGHRAGWIFSDKAPKSLTDQIEKGPATIGQYNYKFSGPEEKPKLFVSRTPVKELLQE